MAGIYIHIPFCKQACNYCNFHFTTSLLYKQELINSIIGEIELRKDFFEGDAIETIYFGGGSPSLLETDEIKLIIDKIYSTFQIGDLKEITLEANPDDLTKEKIKALKSTVINRFSIGVQSFFDEDLKWMNRAHDAQQADRAIKTAQDAGFENLTIDLIYGIPTLTDLNWKKNLQQAIDLKIPHISAYGLTVEEKTPLAKLIGLGKKQNVDEIKSASQMSILIETLTNNGFEHYEISNFALPNRYAIHNTNYWKGKKYIGIGPSAHSYNGNERSWNINNNQKYMVGVSNKKLSIEKEILSAKDKINEWLMTGLRTQWGCNFKDASSLFESSWLKEILNTATPFIQQNKLQFNNQILQLTNDGKFIADRIISDLMRT